jgi:hypothetical protein
VRDVLDRPGPLPDVGRRPAADLKAHPAAGGDRGGEPAPDDSPKPGVLRVVKAFTCDSGAIPGDTPIAELPDMPGERLFLRPSPESASLIWW